MVDTRLVGPLYFGLRERRNFKFLLLSFGASRFYLVLTRNIKSLNESLVGTCVLLQLLHNPIIDLLPKLALAITEELTEDGR